MTNKKSIVYVFAMPYGQTELEFVEPICPRNHGDYLGFEGRRIEDKYGATICDGHYHFKEPVSLGTIASFIQEIADIMMTPFYFALKKNGRIWIAERTGEDDIIHTPDGPFRVVIVDDVGGKGAVIEFVLLKDDGDAEPIKEKIAEQIFNKDTNEIPIGRWD